MSDKGLRLVVRTALMLAVTVLFQMLRPLFLWNPIVAQIVIGSLVNIALFVSAATLGWRGSVVVAAASPFTAWLLGQVYAQFGQVPHPLLIPFIAAGNLALVLLFEWIEKFRNEEKLLWAGVVAASIVKTLVLFCLIVQVFVPVLLPGLDLNPKVAAALTASFGWMQLATAVIGGVVAIPVIKGVRRARLKARNGEANI